MFQILAAAISLVWSSPNSILNAFVGIPCKICINFSICAVAWYHRSTDRYIQIATHITYKIVHKLAKSFETLFMALNLMSICTDNLLKLYNSLFKPKFRTQSETCRYIYETNKFMNSLIFFSMAIYYIHIQWMLW